jgi:16S rRNA (cytidine1402-2'-O)-methyltransferase
MQLLEAAQLAAGQQTYPASALYLVATPIGNLADVSLRAVHVLSLVDAIACEDTRHTAGLLRSLGLHKPLLACHEHNEREASAGVVARLQAGERIAYVSDAGTPGVSDPGALLARAVLEAGLRVLPIPGASAAIAALSASGCDARMGFEFHGFLPTKAQALAQSVAQLASIQRPTIVFEAPHRIEATASALSALGDQRVTICRELTKQFETVALMPCADFSAWLAADANRGKGEFVLVIHPSGGPAQVDGNPQLDEVLNTLLPQVPLKTAVALACQLLNLPKNAVYARAVALKEAKGED